ncbi:hypothetical protein [uncultured Acetatifactor sp.]|uniref:hypothetical protein n=1 Tax=uncultured Acetatifactor sp. TaxID=1671927 RepID=UPI00260FE0E1|nr:hypothetical protein [uncultured Acetatifactor sp.]
MDNMKNMWDFPVMEGVSFQKANRVHPLMQARVEKLMQGWTWKRRRPCGRPPGMMK